MDNKFVVRIPDKMARKLLELQQKQVDKGISYDKPLEQLVNECIEKVILYWENKCILTKIVKLFIQEMGKK